MFTVECEVVNNIQRDGPIFSTCVVVMFALQFGCMDIKTFT